MLSHLVYWHEMDAASIVLVFVTGDAFLVKGEERARVLVRLLAME